MIAMYLRVQMSCDSTARMVSAIFTKCSNVSSIFLSLSLCTCVSVVCVCVGGGGKGGGKSCKDLQMCDIIMFDVPHPIY